MTEPNKNPLFLIGMELGIIITLSCILTALIYLRINKISPVEALELYLSESPGIEAEPEHTESTCTVGSDNSETSSSDNDLNGTDNSVSIPTDVSPTGWIYGGIYDTPTAPTVTVSNSGSDITNDTTAVTATSTNSGVSNVSSSYDSIESADFTSEEETFDPTEDVSNEETATDYSDATEKSVSMNLYWDNTLYGDNNQLLGNGVYIYIQVQHENSIYPVAIAANDANIYVPIDDAANCVQVEDYCYESYGNVDINFKEGYKPVRVEISPNLEKINSFSIPVENIRLEIDDAEEEMIICNNCAEFICRSYTGCWSICMNVNWYDRAIELASFDEL